jgi:hypothetical protein
MTPEVSWTVWPDVIDVVEMMMSVAEVPTVKPETITVPALLRSSARAAVPVAEAVTEIGTPEIVSVVPEATAGGFGRAIVARTPVAPDKADVPMTSDPALPAPEPTT